MLWLTHLKMLLKTSILNISCLNFSLHLLLLNFILTNHHLYPINDIVNVLFLWNFLSFAEPKPFKHEIQLFNFTSLTLIFLKKFLYFVLLLVHHLLHMNILLIVLVIDDHQALVLTWWLLHLFADLKSQLTVLRFILL